MRNLGVPFCRVCRQVIWNRIGPLATLQARARTPISVVARFPEHLDVFAVGERRPHDEQLVGSDRAAGPAGSTCRAASLRPAARDRRSPPSPATPVISTCSPSAPTIVSTAAGGTSAAAGTRWFPIGNLQCRPGSTVNVVSPLQRSPRPVHHRVRRARSCRRGGTRAPAGRSWFQVQGGVAAPGATVTAIARYPFHLDLFTVGTDNRVYSCWWDERIGLARSWFAIGDPAVCRSDSTVYRRRAFSRPARSVHHRRATAGSCPTWWNARSGWGTWFQVSGGVASPGVAGHGDRALLEPPRSVRHRHRQPDLQHVVARQVIIGPAGSTSRAASANRVGRSRRSPESTEHIDLFTVGADGLVYSTWWDGATGWAGWFAIGRDVIGFRFSWSLHGRRHHSVTRGVNSASLRYFGKPRPCKNPSF